MHKYNVGIPSLHSVCSSAASHQRFSTQSDSTTLNHINLEPLISRFRKSAIELEVVGVVVFFDQMVRCLRSRGLQQESKYISQLFPNIKLIEM